MSANRLDPELRTVVALFDDGATYTVPIYQRNYAWRAEQIEQLISDIQDSVAAGEDGYFLGNLIVTERKSPNLDYEVIDGQQRLTTLCLLLTVLEDGKLSSVHRDRLRYESRPRATEALRRIASDRCRISSSIPQAAANEDAGIHEGLNVIRQFIEQHPALRYEEARGKFADFLREKVTLVRVSLPPKTDLNRYFEIMNTRGQQLQQVDIVKARLMSRLLDETERACFAWIWDACADMNSYVQMSLTSGDPTQRSEIFGNEWSWVKTGSFEELMEVHRRASGKSGPGDANTAALPISAALFKYAAAGAPPLGEDTDNVRFRSTMEFPAFLLHVLTKSRIPMAKRRMGISMISGSSSASKKLLRTLPAKEGLRGSGNSDLRSLSVAMCSTDLFSSGSTPPRTERTETGHCNDC